MFALLGSTFSAIIDHQIGRGQKRRWEKRGTEGKGKRAIPTRPNDLVKHEMSKWLLGLHSAKYEFVVWIEAEGYLKLRRTIVGMVENHDCIIIIKAMNVGFCTAIVQLAVCSLPMIRIQTDCS